jgi:excisionase family DNA binding protein
MLPELLKQQTQTEPLLYSREETARKLDISLSTLKKMIEHREIPIVRRGTRVLISRKAIDEWIRRSET